MLTNTTSEVTRRIHPMVRASWAICDDSPALHYRRRFSSSSNSCWLLAIFAGPHDLLKSIARNIDSVQQNNDFRSCTSVNAFPCQEISQHDELGQDGCDTECVKGTHQFLNHLCRRSMIYRVELASSASACSRLIRSARYAANSLSSNS